ncbi:Uncharacterized protein Adt_12553 [Abeliophyllum distichum]|uniref:Uncharacterized protein n=1 Tax=Abeliophyllum distichum TaxID=126358 RepID=A0ABD1UR18_9LAMI
MIVGGSQPRRINETTLQTISESSYQLSNTIKHQSYPRCREVFLSKEDSSHVLQLHSDAFVITMPISKINIHRTLVDEGSSVNVLYLRTFKQIEINERHIRPFLKLLQGFTRDFIDPNG